MWQVAAKLLHIASWPGFSCDCNAVCRTTGGAAITPSYALFKASLERTGGHATWSRSTATHGWFGSTLCNCNCSKCCLTKPISRCLLSSWGSSRRRERSRRKERSRRCRGRRGSRGSRGSWQAKPATFDRLNLREWEEVEQQREEGRGSMHM